MNCKEFRERISAAVDRCLYQDEQNRFDEHALRCSPCRREFEDEQATKRVVQTHTRIVPVPPVLQNSILSALERAAVTPDAGPSLWQRFFRHRLTRPAIAFAVTVVLVILVLTDPREKPPSIARVSVAGFSPNNVVGQSLATYHQVLRGDIAPEIQSSDQAQLLNFFDGKTTFPVVVPRLGNLTLVGGAVNDHKGMRLAHVVYRLADTLLYVYEACWETVQRGEILELGTVELEQLRRTGWYAGRCGDGEAVVLWTHGRTLCIAISHMDADRLYASLKHAPVDAAP